MKYKIFYINLDRVPERRAFMNNEFQKVGLDGAIRFSAVDAKVEGALSDAGFRQGIGDRWALPKSAIACFESHRAVWKLAMDLGVDAALIMEDDLVMSSELPPALETLFEAANNFDVVKLDHSPALVRFGPNVRLNGIDLRSIQNVTTSAGAYVVSRTGIEKLLARSEEYGDTLDDFLYRPQAGWQMFQIFPAVSAQLVHIEKRAEQQPDINLRTSERERDPQINESDLPRGPAWFRIRKELRRLGSRLLWRLWGKNALQRKGGYYGSVAIAEDLINL